MVQTRTVAPASGTPRELKTISSLRVPCAGAGPTAPGNTCSANASSAQRKPIAFARLQPDWAGRRVAIFDRIIGSLFNESVRDVPDSRNDRGKLPPFMLGPNESI